MQVLRSPGFAFAVGIAAVVLLAIAGGQATGDDLADALSQRANGAISNITGAAGVHAEFRSPGGLPSRHPVLVGGEGIDDTTRAIIAREVAALPGVGGVRWADGSLRSRSEMQQMQPLHCQEDVAVLLRERTIRFEESSARIDESSGQLIDEVAEALRPCLGSIIAITGHTDASGLEPGNIALSRERAEAVRDELVSNGIPADGLRVRGVGSREPAEGLEPEDPANRRIEFTVVATEPVRPTPVDTPGPG